MSFDAVDQIIKYEAGELDEDGVVTLFQYLINTGIVWCLQGSYGRMAWGLIRSGRCKPPEPEFIRGDIE